MESSPSQFLSPLQKRLLRMIFERAAESASQALSTWLGQTVHMNVSEIDDVELVDAAELLGIIATCGTGEMVRLALMPNRSSVSAGLGSRVAEGG